MPTQTPAPHTPEEPFSLLSTLRYSPALLHHPQNSLCSPNPTKGSPFYMLQYHRDRLHNAAEYFGWMEAMKAVEDGEMLEMFLGGEVERWRGGNDGEGGDLRIRLLLSRTGTLTTTLNPTPPLSLHQLYPTTLSPTPSNLPNPVPDPISIHLPTDPTLSTPHTRFKTTLRTPYTCARLSVSLLPLPTTTNTAEVLLYDPSGYITEGSLTSVYFYRGGEWVTPRGGQEGTTRRWAVGGGGLAGWGQVLMEGVKEGEEVWVSNGVRGFLRGRVVLGGGGEGEAGEV